MAITVDLASMRPTTVIIDDIIPTPSKGHSMPIFKFHSGDTKPSALKIWTTLIDTPIHPREGYTEDQIRYRMFICLQLGHDFKVSVSICNALLDSDKTGLEPLLSNTRLLTSCAEADFSDLEVLSDSFPNWVSSALYTPYYLTKMLCFKKDDYSILCSLFNRDHMEPAEFKHMLIDYGDPGLTAYKLYNSMHMDEMLSYTTISYGNSPRTVEHKSDLHQIIRNQLLKSIEVSDNYIIPENAKTTIPYFKLRTSDASQ